jgi:hypothetical protein
MAARDARRDCRIGSSLSLRERDLGVRVQSLLNPDAEVEDIPTLTPALSRRVAPLSVPERGWGHRH